MLDQHVRNIIPVDLAYYFCLSRQWSGLATYWLRRPLQRNRKPVNNRSGPVSTRQEFIGQWKQNNLRKGLWVATTAGRNGGSNDRTAVGV